MSRTDGGRAREGRRKRGRGRSGGREEESVGPLSILQGVVGLMEFELHDFLLLPHILHIVLQLLSLRLGLIHLIDMLVREVLTTKLEAILTLLLVFLILVLLLLPLLVSSSSSSSSTSSATCRFTFSAWRCTIALSRRSISARRDCADVRKQQHKVGQEEGRKK